jgi:hypothetical protein
MGTNHKFTIFTGFYNYLDDLEKVYESIKKPNILKLGMTCLRRFQRRSFSFGGPEESRKK